MPESRDDLELWWAEFFQPHVRAACEISDDFNRAQRVGFLLGRLTAISDQMFGRHLTDAVIEVSRNSTPPLRLPG